MSGSFLRNRLNSTDEKTIALTRKTYAGNREAWCQHRAECHRNKLDKWTVLCSEQEADHERLISVVNSPAVESQVRAEPANTADNQTNNLQTDRRSDRQIEWIYNIAKSGRSNEMTCS